MTQSPEAPKSDAPPAKQPYGPGLMMIFGVCLVAVGVYCGHDAFFRDDWVKTEQTWKMWFNGACMAAAIIGAIYCFAMALVRSRKAAERAAAGEGAANPPEQRP